MKKIVQRNRTYIEKGGKGAQSRSNAPKASTRSSNAMRSCVAAAWSAERALRLRNCVTNSQGSRVLCGYFINLTSETQALRRQNSNGNRSTALSRPTARSVSPSVSQGGAASRPIVGIVVKVEMLDAVDHVISCYEAKMISTSASPRREHQAGQRITEEHGSLADNER